MRVEAKTTLPLRVAPARIVVEAKKGTVPDRVELVLSLCNGEGTPLLAFLGHIDGGGSWHWELAAVEVVLYVGLEGEGNLTGPVDLPEILDRR